MSDADEEQEEVDPRMASGEYQGVEFYLDQFWRFRVPELDEALFESKGRMESAIDEMLKARAKASREKVSVKVIGQDGVARELTGIHAGNGSLLLSPKYESRYGRSSLYLNCDLANQAIKAKAELDARLEVIEEVLEKLKISAESSMFDSYKPEKFPEYMERLKKSISSATKASGMTIQEAMHEAAKKTSK